MKGFQAFGQIPSPTFTAIELPFAIGCGVSVRAGHRNTFEPAGTERARLTFALETSQKAHLTCNHSLMCASVRACMGVGVSVAVNVGVSVSVCVCVCVCVCMAGGVRLSNPQARAMQTPPQLPLAMAVGFEQRPQ